MIMDMKFKFNSSGFTLVELLVVIAIIGVLASVALVAINPLEQIRRSQDQAAFSTAGAYVGALQAYSAAKGSMPWPVSCAAPAAGSALALSSMGGCTTAMITSGELKQGSTNQSVLTKLFLSEMTTGGVSSPVICFKPQSSQMVTDTVKNVYSQTGGACATPGTAACYICAF